MSKKTAWVALSIFCLGCSSNPPSTTINQTPPSPSAPAPQENPAQTASAPVDSAPPTQGIAPVDKVSWWRPGPVRDFQIFHFKSLADFKKNLKKSTSIVNLELDQIEDGGGVQVIDLAHQQGAKVVCYISEGYEDWRKDEKQYPGEAKGGPICDKVDPKTKKCKKIFKGENWGNPTKKTLVDFLAKRMDRCKALGGDGIELDNMDQHENDVGFQITIDENLKAQKELVALAHGKGLAFFAKNATALAKDLAPLVEGIFIEQCHQHKECSSYESYKGKPVMISEYETDCVSLDWAACRRTSNKDYFEPKLHSLKNKTNKNATRNEEKS